MPRIGKRSENEQDRLVAAALYAGDPPPVACARAGYSKSTCKVRAHKICRSERVQARLREISKNIHANELTTLGRARIHQKLTSNEKNDKVMLGYIRTGAELEGGLGNRLIGDRGELHLHATLPPRVQQMLEDKMLELMGQRNAEAIDAEIVSQEEKQDGSAPTPTEPLAPTNTPDVNIPTDDALHRRQIVTGRRYIKAMHDFLGVGQ